MKPPWLYLLLTPMTAPNSRRWCAMRVVLIVGVVPVAGGVTALTGLYAVFDHVGIGVRARLYLALAVFVAAYAVPRMRADAPHLDRVSGGYR